MKKYLSIFSCQLKRGLVYREQALLMGVFSLCKVVLAHLLWRVVMGEAGSFGGFSLPAITSYYLLGGALSPLMNNSEALSAFSAEIKSGAFSKYLVRPVSAVGWYLSASVGQAVPATLCALLALALAMLFAPGYFQALDPAQLLAALPVVLLGALLSGMLCYLMALATFKFTDIGFLYTLQNIALLFLSGATLPLNLVAGERAAMLLPFSYTLYYPVMLMLGRAEISARLAVLVILGWLAVLGALCRLLDRRARGLFEGVGL